MNAAVLTLVEGNIMDTVPVIKLKNACRWTRSSLFMPIFETFKDIRQCLVAEP